MQGCKLFVCTKLLLSADSVRAGLWVICIGVHRGGGPPVNASSSEKRCAATVKIRLEKSHGFRKSEVIRINGTGINNNAGWLAGLKNFVKRFDKNGVIRRNPTTVLVTVN